MNGRLEQYLSNTEAKQLDNLDEEFLAIADDFGKLVADKYLSVV